LPPQTGHFPEERTALVTQVSPHLAHRVQKTCLEPSPDCLLSCKIFSLRRALAIGVSFLTAVSISLKVRRKSAALSNTHFIIRQFIFLLHTRMALDAALRPATQGIGRLV
jgi:hypothetical protein